MGHTYLDLDEEDSSLMTIRGKEAQEEEGRLHPTSPEATSVPVVIRRPQAAE